MIDSADAWPQPDAEAISGSPDGASSRRRCAHCQGSFGLIRRRRAGRQFCSVACMEAYDEAMRRSVRARARWLDFLDRTGLARLR
jgi:hypothetical protein